MKLAIGMTGASGASYTYSLLKTLKEKQIETHLIMSEWATVVLKEETPHTPEELKKLASFTYSNNDLAAPTSSSSFEIDGTIILPCSVKTASDVAHAHTSSLIARSADNALKMKRPLIICIRETPLSTPALENLLKLSQYGATILPLSPGFYHTPKTLDDLTSFITCKILDLFNIPNDEITRWSKQ